MKKEIDTIMSTFESNEPIQYHCDLHASHLELNSYVPSWPGDIIIARGYAADVLMKRYPAKLIRKITYNSVDVMNAIQNCRKDLSSKKIAVLGHPSLGLAAQLIKNISDIPIEIYPVVTPDCDYNDIIDKIISSGCDTVLGGGTSIYFAKKRGLKAHTVPTNAETLYDTIVNSIQMLKTNRSQQAQLKLLETVTGNSQDGYIILNSEGAVELYTSYAGDMLHADEGQIIGKHYSRVLPQLGQLINNIYNTRKPVDNEIINHDDRMYSIHGVPILVDNIINSILIECADVNAIKETELKIRSKLSKKGLYSKYTFNDIVHKSPMIDRLIEYARKYAATDSNIMIRGDTGTGKELFAQSIHAASRRRNGPFVAVNCAAIPGDLLESELFGYAPGAFTGASKEGKPGLFELAHNGTLFLDEIAELPYQFQSKLLRVLQEKEVRRIGDDRTIPIDVRIIAATNRDLLKMTEENQFREDLYFRLNILQLFIPPLSKRKEDIVEIFNFYLEVYSHSLRKYAPKLGSAEEQVLVSHAWKGNIRELSNVAERFMILYSEDENAAALLATCLNPEANEGGMLIHSSDLSGGDTTTEFEGAYSSGSSQFFGDAEDLHNSDGAGRFSKSPYKSAYGNANLYDSDKSDSKCSSYEVNVSDGSYGSGVSGSSYKVSASGGLNETDNLEGSDSLRRASGAASPSRELILHALSTHRSQREAATSLHISRTTLWRRMKEYGIG